MWWVNQGKPRRITRDQVRERIHAITSAREVPPDVNVVVGRTGDVYDPRDGEWLGSLTRKVN